LPAGTDGMGEPPPIMLPKTLVLVGLMGAGKSAVGRRVAAKLEIPLIDADSEIEAAAGSSIEEIFEKHGESAFRDGERRVVARILETQPVHVLATGGGAFLDPSTRALIKERAISVWLRAELDVLFERVSRRSHRPLLKTTDPRTKLAELMEERYPIYAQADIIVDSGDGPIGIMVDRVIEAVAAYLAKEKTA
jgi:shikimate kinase